MYSENDVYDCDYKNLHMQINIKLYIWCKVICHAWLATQKTAESSLYIEIAAHPFNNCYVIWLH